MNNRRWFDYLPEQKEILTRTKLNIQKKLLNYYPIKIISSPYLPVNPISPNVKLNIAIAGLLGLMLGVFLIFFREYNARGYGCERRRIRRGIKIRIKKAETATDLANQYITYMEIKKGIDAIIHIHPFLLLTLHYQGSLVFKTSSTLSPVTISKPVSTISWPTSLP